MAFETQRIVLRTPTPDDDGSTLAIFTDPNTMRHLPHLFNQPWDVSRVAARREARAHDELQGQALSFSLLLRSGDGAGGLLVAGLVGYRTLWAEGDVKRGEVGIIVAYESQGRGLVWDVHLLLLTLGFEEMGLEVVEWLTAEGNEGMRAVLRKMGCKEHGVLTEDEKESRGGGEKLVMYSLHKSSWDDCKKMLRQRVDRLAGS